MGVMSSIKFQNEELKHTSTYQFSDSVPEHTAERTELALIDSCNGGYVIISLVIVIPISFSMNCAALGVT